MKIQESTINQCLIFLCNLFPVKNLKHVQWMNPKPSATEAYVPTNIEHVANILTHGISILPSILGALELRSRSRTTAQTISSIIYGLTLVSLFVISTLFHVVFYSNKFRSLKHFLHRCDRAMIYIFIAGSYFPWLTILPFSSDSVAVSMKWLVWVFAFLGIVYQQVFHEKYKGLETFFYLLMGIGPALFVLPQDEFYAAAELKLGGILYILGVIFFKMDGCIPCAHAVWHVFVVVAAAAHYYAILVNLYPDLPKNNELNQLS